MNEANESHLRSIVSRLGGFHTEMSYLGTIGHPMQNTGLNEAIEIVYGGNTVRQMICGKAVAQARRGHFLLDAALNILLLSDAFQLPLLMSLNDCSTIPKDTDTSLDPEDIPTGNVMLETETETDVNVWRTLWQYFNNKLWQWNYNKSQTIFRQVVLRQWGGYRFRSCHVMSMRN